MIGIYVYTRGVRFAFRSVQLELLNGFLLYFFLSNFCTTTTIK